MTKPETPANLTETVSDSVRDPRWVKAVSPWTNRARRPTVWSVTRVPAKPQAGREETPDPQVRNLPLAA